MEFGILPSKTTKFHLSSVFYLFAVFGLTQKRFLKCRVIKTTFWCVFPKKISCSESLLVWCFVTLPFICFPLCFWTRSHFFMKLFIWLSHFSFCSFFRTFWILNIVRLPAAYLFCRMVLVSATVMHQIFQNFFFSCEFAIPQLIRLPSGFRHCKTNVQVLPIAVFGLAQISNYSKKICIWGGKIVHSNRWNWTFLPFSQLIMPELTLVSGFEFENFFIRRMKLK